MANTIVSTSVPTEHGMIILNPDGTNVGSSIPTGAATSANQDTQTTLLQGIAGFVPSVYDSVALSYTGSNLTGVVFKNGSTTISTLTLSYTGSQLDSVVKT